MDSLTKKMTKVDCCLNLKYNSTNKYNNTSRKVRLELLTTSWPSIWFSRKNIVLFCCESFIHDSFFFFLALLVEQIFTHLYTEKFLDMRYAFREAVNFVNSGEKVNDILEMLVGMFKMTGRTSECS